MLLTFWLWLNANALPLTLAGLAAILCYHLWRWRSDRALALRPVTVPAPLAPLQAFPRVTILVAAWNEAAHIAAHMRSIRALRYPNKEYVLCAGGKDATYALACQQATDWMQVLEQQPGEGKQTALRRGLKHVTGDIIFLTDADSVLSDTAFERTLAPLINEAEAVATGTSEPLPTQHTQPFVLEHWFTDLYVQAQYGAYSGGLLGRNAALTRQALRAAGDLQAAVSSGTDYQLAKALLANGYRIRYVPNSIVPTLYPDTWRSHIQRQTRWLRNVVVHGLHFRAYGEVISCLIPSFVGLAMLLGGALALWQGGILLALWTLVMAHTLASRARYIHFGELVTGLRFPAYWQLPLTLLGDFVVWTRALLQYLVPAWRKRW